MDRADFKLGFLLAYVLAFALHAGLAYAIQSRRPRALEIRIFAGANAMLAGWHLLQWVEYAQVNGMLQLSVQQTRALLGGQLVVGLLVLVLFFHLFATFERVYRRRAPSLRAAITTHVHRRQAFYVPLAYVSVLLGGLLVLVDAGGVSDTLGALRSNIGPTSAYLFGGTLLFMTFALFPARAGQEKILVPSLGRALLMISLGVALGLIVLWHGAHPTRTQLVLLPWLHLHSVAFCVFLALVRYEFSFMDRYVAEGLRFLVWAVVVVLAYFAFNRIQFSDPVWGRYATSLGRIGVLLGAVALAPALGRGIARFSDRVFFDRHLDLEREVHRFSTRLAECESRADLIEGAGHDIARAVHAKQVRIVVGRDEEAAAETFDTRLKVGLGPPQSTVGTMLLADRRNLYPYFEAERRYLVLAGELLGAALVGLRRREGRHAAPAASSSDARTDALERQLHELREVLHQERSAVPAMRRFHDDWLDQVLAVADEVAERDPPAGAEILRRLHSLREYRAQAMGQVVTLQDEMNHIQDLLVLEKLRQRNRLDVDLGLEPELEDQLLPRGILAPLVHNALVHGVGPQLRTGRVEVHARRSESGVEISVLDNGGGFPDRFDPSAPRAGGGLSRVQAELRTFDADGAHLVIDTTALDGADVRVRLPLRSLNGDSLGD